jgi:RHS repeat-associated protein
LITRYVRDASGNVMSVYNDTSAIEQPIYGSSRLGMYKGSVLEGHQTLGRRSYELSNHLGNVLSVITDNIGKSTADTVWASVESSSDYYPFGMAMAGRSYSSSSYRYGFNGKEKDDKGELGETSYDYGFRIYNPRIAKFLSVDPLSKDYPWYTPYQFAGNTPIQAIDLDGLEPKSVVKFNNVSGKYNFTKPAIHVLYLTTGVDKRLLETVVVQPRSLGQYRPLYDADEGGGGITVGDGSYNTITYTENYFENNSSKYKGNGYGMNVGEWLDISSHEVGHLTQIAREGGLVSYLSEFVKQYTVSGDHDGAPYEKEADVGQDNFRGFNRFVDNYIGKGELNKLFNLNISDEAKISKIDIWHSVYKTYQDLKKSGQKNITLDDIFKAQKSNSNSSSTNASSTETLNKLP